MAELVAELILTLDAAARGTKSPGLYGYGGPEFLAWMAGEGEKPHRTLMGRKTYEMLNDLPEEAKDDGWRRMAETPGWVMSKSLKSVEWPNLEIVPGDLEGHVRKWKADGSEIRTAGSLSVVAQLAKAGLVDRLRVMLCPLVLPRTGIEPAFEGWEDVEFDLLDTKLLDGRVLVLDYRPKGPPPVA